MERVHGNNTVVGKFEMQTRALVLEDVFMDKSDFFSIGRDFEEDPRFPRWDSDAVSQVLNGAKPVVIDLRNVDSDPIWFSSLNQGDHCNWCVTFWFGTCMSNRALTMENPFGNWSISNNAYALFRSFTCTEKRTTNAQEVFKKDGTLHYISFEQTRTIPYHDSSASRNRDITFHVHFRVERISDYVNDRKSDGQDELYSILPDDADDFHTCMRACYANQSTCW